MVIPNNPNTGHTPIREDGANKGSAPLNTRKDFKDLLGQGKKTPSTTHEKTVEKRTSPPPRRVQDKKSTPEEEVEEPVDSEEDVAAAKERATQSPETPVAAKPKAPPAKSVFDFYRQGQAKVGPKAMAASGAIAPKEKAASDKKEKPVGEKGEEKIASATPFQPLVGNAPVAEGSVQQTARGSPIAAIQALVDQIVEKMYSIETQGKTDIVIVIKHPPLFAGANVVLTTFDTASKEFNIAFENLRPDAKLLLDQNLSSLKTALEEKGNANAVHIITTTTLREQTLSMESSGQQSQRDPREGGGQQQGKQKQKQQPDQEA
jgi:hypothetical protein